MRRPSSTTSGLRDLGQQAGHPFGKLPCHGHLCGESLRRGPVGELAVEKQLPHVLERTACGEVGRRVLAVVVEALLPPHVADRCLRHDDALEAPRHVGSALVGRPDLRDREQVADRHHADQSARVDDRQVPVVVMGQAGPGRAHLFVGPHGVRVRRHPTGDRLARRVGVLRGGAQQVAFGEDSGDGPSGGHHHRTDLVLVHRARSRRQRRIGVTGHRWCRHELLDGGRHGTLLVPGGPDPRSDGAGPRPFSDSVVAWPAGVNVDQVNMSTLVEVDRMLETDEAARRLGVKVNTLYAYVSRGLLRSHRAPDGRRSLFEVEEVEGLARRSRGGSSGRDADGGDHHRGHAADRAGPLYRGHRAVELATTASFRGRRRASVGRERTGGCRRRRGPRSTWVDLLCCAHRADRVVGGDGRRARPGPG